MHYDVYSNEAIQRLVIGVLRQAVKDIDNKSHRLKQDAKDFISDINMDAEEILSLIKAFEDTLRSFNDTQRSEYGQ